MAKHPASDIACGSWPSVLWSVGTPMRSKRYLSTARVPTMTSRCALARVQSWGGRPPSPVSYEKLIAWGKARPGEYEVWYRVLGPTAGGGGAYARRLPASRAARGATRSPAQRAAPARARAAEELRPRALAERRRARVSAGPRTGSGSEPRLCDLYSWPASTPPPSLPAFPREAPGRAAGAAGPRTRSPGWASPWPQNHFRAVWLSGRPTPWRCRPRAGARRRRARRVRGAGGLRARAGGGPRQRCGEARPGGRAGGSHRFYRRGRRSSTRTGCARRCSGRHALHAAWRRVVAFLLAPHVPADVRVLEATGRRSTA